MIIPLRAGATSTPTPYPQPTVITTYGGVEYTAPTPIVIPAGLQIDSSSINSEYNVTWATNPSDPLYLFITLPAQLYADGLRFNGHSASCGGSWSYPVSGNTITFTAASGFCANPVNISYGLMDQAPLTHGLTAGTYTMQTYIAPDLTVTPAPWGAPVIFYVQVGITPSFTPTFTNSPIVSATTTWTVSPTYTGTPTPLPGCPRVDHIVSAGAKNYPGWDGTYFWAAYDQSLEKIDPVSGTLAGAWSLGGQGIPSDGIMEIAYDGTYIWLGCYDTYGTLAKFNPTTGLVEKLFQMNPTGVGGENSGGIQSVVWDPNEKKLWIGVAQSNTSLENPGYVLKFDPISYAIDLTVTGQAGVNGICYAYSAENNQGYILAANYGFISRINVDTGEYQTNTTDADTYRVCSDGTYYYAGTFLDPGLVRKYNLATNELVKSWNSGSLVNSIAVYGQNVWVVGNDGNITISSVIDGSLVCTLYGLGYSGIVHGGNYMCALNYSNSTIVDDSVLSPTMTATCSPTPRNTKTYTYYITPSAIRPIMLRIRKALFETFASFIN